MNSEELAKIIEKGSIEVTIHPNSKKKELLLSKKGYELYIKSKPENNKANEESITYIGKIFQKEIKLIKGKTRRKKLFRII